MPEIAKQLCKCGYKNFVLSRYRRLWNLGLCPVRCNGCGALLEPHIPDCGHVKVVLPENDMAKKLALEVEAQQREKMKVWGDEATNLPEGVWDEFQKFVSRWNAWIIRT